MIRSISAAVRCCIASSLMIAFVLFLMLDATRAFAQEIKKPDPPPPAAKIEAPAEASLSLNNLLVTIELKKQEERAARAERLLLDGQVTPTIQAIADVLKIDLNLYEAKVSEDGKLFFLLKPPKKEGAKQ